MKSLFRILGEKKGATSVEYGLILALIFLAMIVSLRNVAATTTNMWNNVSNTVANG
jgi:pilus assembly protein Flp/PilA